MCIQFTTVYHVYVYSIYQVTLHLHNDLPIVLVVQTAAQTTVGGGYDLVWANNLREVGNAVCNQLWVLNHVGGVCNNAWVQQNVVWKFDVLPDLPLVSVAWGGCLEGVAADLGAQNLFQDVTERHVGHVWTVPRAPADVQAGLFLRNILNRLVE